MKLQYWLDVIRQCRVSGLTNQIWCEQHDPSLKSYYYWLSQIRKLDFAKLAYMKRETTFIIPRTMIRDFIQILDVKYRNPDKGIRSILTAYKFAVDEERSYEDIDD